MGNFRRSAWGLFGIAPLLFACGESSHGSGACTDCANGGRGGSSGAGGRAGSASAGGAHSGGGTSSGGAAAGGSTEAKAGAGGESAAGAGEPERVVAVTYLRNLIVKNGSIFYSDVADNEQEFTSGHLRGVSVTVGTPRTYAEAPKVPEETASTREIWGIASDGVNIYWSEYPLNASHVAKTSIATGETVDVWSDPSCEIRKPLTLEGTQLYWLASCVGVSGQLMTASTTGGAASVIASGTEPGWKPNPYGANEEARGLAVGNGFAVWTQVTGAVVSLPLSGGQSPLQITTLTQVDGPSAIAMVGERAFFLQPDYKLQGRGDIWSIVPGTDFVTVATSMVHISQEQLSEEPTALTVDERFVYWGVTDGIKRAPLDGGESVDVVTGLANTDPRALAVDDTHIYWADDTAIWRAPKSSH